MVQGDAYRELRGWLEEQSAPDPLGFITRLQSGFDCERVTYLNGSLADGALQILELRHVPARERQRLARALKEQRNLPQVASMLSHLAPALTDLSDFRDKRRKAEESVQHGAGARDIIFPLLHRNGFHA